MNAIVPVLLALTATPALADPGNPAIDARQHLRIATQALEYRQTRRVDEAGFLTLAAHPGTVIVDARSPEAFAMLHVKGAINLPFPDLTVESLAQALPDKNATLLIYCNNNFVNQPAAFPTKKASASLNLSTYAALYDYGYRNVYELAPVLDPDATTLPLEGTLAARE